MAFNYLMNDKYAIRTFAYYAFGISLSYYLSKFGLNTAFR